ncbi:MAG TPA: DUF3592 domain-containing protein [Ktedonobacteraceae bacterium]|nr:DUF3592 domain-containing protein [Ktedonobacteraceae bacterium]
MNYPQITRPRFSGARLFVMGVLLAVFLISAALFCWLALPAWQIHLSGVQANAIAHAHGYCEGDNDNPGISYAFTYEFTDARGQQHRVAQDGFCTDVYQDGDHVTVWYLPHEPTRMVTDLEVHMLYIFTALGALETLILGVVFFKLLKPRRASWPGVPLYY